MPPAPIRHDEEHVCLWEKSVVEHPLLVVRIHAGASCAVTHGMVHWSDLPRSHTLRFTWGAVSGRVVMKNQAYLTAWAAPRSGFLDFDWSGPWIAAASAVGLLGADFVLYGISNNCVELQLRSAEYQGCLKFIRYFLCLTSIHCVRRFCIHRRSPQLEACVQHRIASVERQH